MPCFDPREVIFLTNKWDIIETEDTIGVNEHEKTWNKIMEKLKTEWIYLREENVFKVSLKQVKIVNKYKLFIIRVDFAVEVFNNYKWKRDMINVFDKLNVTIFIESHLKHILKNSYSDKR